MSSFSIFPAKSTSKPTKPSTKTPQHGLRFPTISIPTPTNRSQPSHPPPPASPCPWLWRCHSCQTIYRLAVTRRCLECDHQFCLGLPPTPSSSSSSSSTRKAGPKGRKRKRTRGGPCKAEFDYTGWALYNSWRRTILLNPPSPLSEKNENNNKKQKVWGDEYAAVTAALAGGIRAGNGNPQEPFNDRRDGLFVRRKHNCWLHCDFPSDCHHAIYKAQQEGRPILAVAEALDVVTAAMEAADRRDGGSRDERATSTVEEAAGEDGPLSDDADKENVSPCSPEPPRDLMCEPEVSPITPIEDDQQSPISGSKNVDSEMWEDVDLGGSSTQSTTLEFEVYVDDTHNTAQLLTVDDLESAYSEMAWFTETAGGDRPGDDSQPCMSPERRSRRDKMLALLGRRNAITTIGATTTSRSGGTNSRTTIDQASSGRRQRRKQLLEGSEEWESGSDDSSSSSSSSSSSASSVASIFDGDIGRGGGVDLVTVVDLDGDSLMSEALSPIDEEDADSMLSPTTPVKEDGMGDEPDLVSLFGMRNAFMRGDF